MQKKGKLNSAAKLYGGVCAVILAPCLLYVCCITVRCMYVIQKNYILYIDTQEYQYFHTPLQNKGYYFVDI